MESSNKRTHPPDPGPATVPVREEPALSELPSNGWSDWAVDHKRRKSSQNPVKGKCSTSVLSSEELSVYGWAPVEAEERYEITLCPHCGACLRPMALPSHLERMHPKVPSGLQSSMLPGNKVTPGPDKTATAGFSDQVVSVLRRILGTAHNTNLNPAVIQELLKTIQAQLLEFQKSNVTITAAVEHIGSIFRALQPNLNPKDIYLLITLLSPSQKSTPQQNSQRASSPSLLTQALLNSSGSNNAKKQQRPRSPSSLPNHLKEFNSDVHCGVLIENSENSKRNGLPCMRSLLCKNHSVAERRNVARSRKFEDLVAEFREAKKARQLAKGDGSTSPLTLPAAFGQKSTKTHSLFKSNDSDGAGDRCTSPLDDGSRSQFSPVNRAESGSPLPPPPPKIIYSPCPLLLPGVHKPSAIRGPVFSSSPSPTSPISREFLTASPVHEKMLKLKDVYGPSGHGLSQNIYKSPESGSRSSKHHASGAILRETSKTTQIVEEFVTESSESEKAEASEEDLDGLELEYTSHHPQPLFSIGDLDVELESCRYERRLLQREYGTITDGVSEVVVKFFHAYQSKLGSSRSEKSAESSSKSKLPQQKPSLPHDLAGLETPPTTPSPKSQAAQPSSNPSVPKPRVLVTQPMKSALKRQAVPMQRNSHLRIPPPPPPLNRHGSGSNGPSPTLNGHSSKASKQFSRGHTGIDNVAALLEQRKHRRKALDPSRLKNASNMQPRPFTSSDIALASAVNDQKITSTNSNLPSFPGKKPPPPPLLSRSRSTSTSGQKQSIKSSTNNGPILEPATNANGSQSSRIKPPSLKRNKPTLLNR